MKRMSLLIFCVVMTLFMLVGCASLKALIEQPQLQVYSFNYDGKDYSVMLPKQVPMPPENAVSETQAFFGVYTFHVQYMEGNEAGPNLPVASFWFTSELGVFGLVWHTLESTGEVKHECFLVVKGLPILVEVEELEDYINKLMFGEPDSEGPT